MNFVINHAALCTHELNNNNNLKNKASSSYLCGQPRSYIGWNKFWCLRPCRVLWHPRLRWWRSPHLLAAALSGPEQERTRSQSWGISVTVIRGAPRSTIPEWMNALPRSAPSHFALPHPPLSPVSSPLSILLWNANPRSLKITQRTPPPLPWRG